MTQAQWNARIAARGDVWQYFKMDDASGLPQDSSPDYSQSAHMTAGTGAAYNVAGPFTGAKAIQVATQFTSPVYTPTPSLDVNYGHSKTMEGWVYVNTTPGSTVNLIGAGNVGLFMTASRTLIPFTTSSGFGTAGSTVIPLATWTFVMITSYLSPTPGLGFRVYINDTVELEWADIPWPIPNSFMFFTAVSGFTFSNCALINGGPLTPDLPVSMPQIYRS